MNNGGRHQPSAIFLSVKTIAADKFSYKAGGRDLIIHIRFQNIIENFYQRTHLFVAGFFRRNLPKQGVNILFQYRQH